MAEKEDEREEARFLEPRDTLAHWRDSIPRHLAQRGTAESVEALRRCERALPNLSWIRVVIVDAEREMRRNTWVPLRPTEVIRIMRFREGELVDSTEHLLELLLRILKDYQQRLIDQPAITAAQLWNKQTSGLWRPVDENDLSDQVKQYLQERLVGSGIVVNREVQVSRRPGAAIGDRTDIQVDAIRKDMDRSTLDVITVAIEIKGCWNQEIKTAMRTQLVNNYMVTINAVAGVYLVGWFPKLKWDKTDSRRKRAPNWGASRAQKLFDTQTAEILDETGKNVSALVVDCGF